MDGQWQFSHVHSGCHRLVLIRIEKEDTCCIKDFVRPYTNLFISDRRTAARDDHCCACATTANGIKVEPITAIANFVRIAALTFVLLLCSLQKFLFCECWQRIFKRKLYFNPVWSFLFFVLFVRYATDIIAASHPAMIRVSVWNGRGVCDDSVIIQKLDTREYYRRHCLF